MEQNLLKLAKNRHNFLVSVWGGEGLLSFLVIFVVVVFSFFHEGNCNFLFTLHCDSSSGKTFEEKEAGSLPDWVPEAAYLS